jgi:HK97 family phage major capsid protein
MAEQTVPTKLSDFSGFLTPVMSAPIFDDAARQSIIMRLAKQHPLGMTGSAIPINTSMPVANWVAEGGRKPSTKGTKSLVTMSPKKLAAISVMSAEVFRADPGNYATNLRANLAQAFAIAFDYAAIHDVGGDGTGSGPFDAALKDTTHTVEFGTAASTYLDIVSGLSLLVNDHSTPNGLGRRLTGFAFDDMAEPLLLSAVDGNDRPMLQATAAEGVYASIIGRPTLLGQGIAAGDILGFGGDWSKAAWGVVGGISFNVSTEATVTLDGDLVSLWENNLVAVLAEAEYGFVLADPDYFVAYTEDEGVS